jgi:hypothetical protein
VATRKNTQAKWTTDQIKYQRWLAQSKYERQPHTKELFAKDVLGVDFTTIWRWEQKPGWNEAVTQIVMDALSAHIPEVLASLVREAEKGSIQHIKEFLGLVGIVGDQPTQNANINQRIVVEYADDTDIIAQATSVAERYYQDGEAV